MTMLRRRDFLRSGLIALGAITAGPSVWRLALADPTPGDAPYGPLGPPDANGIRLPAGFTSRQIARAGLPVLPGLYLWHAFPDGGATYPTPDGGWVYVSNSEVPGPALGGAGAVRFDSSGEIVDAYRILVGTANNCAGGPTPWGTWLSCEEHDLGRVWECDPMGAEPAIVWPALGTFSHEAAAVDPVHQHVYLTEDKGDGRFYRFVPDAYPSLASGTLQVARVAPPGPGGAVTWLDIPNPAGIPPTRQQRPESTAFSGGEGCWFDAGIVYFTTKGDNRVWSFDTATAVMSVLYDDNNVPGTPLTGVDNVMVSPRSGDIFVAEDGGDLDVVIITPEGVISRLLNVTGSAHSGSELAGPALNPGNSRFYFSSQRGFGLGVTYEIAGPFRTTR